MLMRMRRKRHLEAHIAAAGERLIDIPPVDVDYREYVKEKEYINLREYFKNDNPFELEIGCGKGQFICELAKSNPLVNYVAIELNISVITAACEKAAEYGIQNVLFIKCGAEIIEKYIEPHTFRRIYLNFSCPYPKNRYANRRLTNPAYLRIYKLMLSTGGEIHQKTDNREFFEYSLESFSAYGYRLKNISLDLHNSSFEGNIVTEYEKKFSELGQPIYRLEAYLP